MIINNDTLIDLLKKLVINGKRVLNVEEAAIFLGFKQDYLYRLTSERKIPHSKPTKGKLMFVTDDLVKWVIDNKVASADEISGLANDYLN